MKKTILSLMFAMMFGMALCSCGNATGSATDVDSTAVDSVDTVLVDSAVVVADSIAVDSVVCE